jgi:hypothetical protein
MLSLVIGWYDKTISQSFNLRPCTTLDARIVIALNFPFMPVWPKEIPMWNWNQYWQWLNLHKNPSVDSNVSLTPKNRPI